MDESTSPDREFHLDPDDLVRLNTLAISLVGWSRTGGRWFPWRNPGWDEYRLVVTELLLQRTRADVVASFVHSFLSSFGNWNELADASEDQLEMSLSGIGLQSRRSISMKALATKVVARGGMLPRSSEELESLPALGQYMVNATQLLVHGLPKPLLDTNMARVIERYIRPRKMADIRHDPWLQAAAQFLVEQGDPKSINWAVLDFAALVCKPRTPVCRECPLSKDCGYVERAKSATDGPGTP